jgi:ribosomal protein L32
MHLFFSLDEQRTTSEKKSSKSIHFSLGMSSQSCVICGSKRQSRTLCNCCQQYLCRDHLKEHDDLLNDQIERLVDDRNQLADQLKPLNINY